MARNTTLRDLMGLGDQATPLRETALVMIDLQNTYRQGIMQLEGVEPAVAEAARPSSSRTSPAPSSGPTWTPS